MQVSQQWLQWLQNSNSVDLELFDDILGQKFTDLTWSDLRKPLYSAVVALLYITDMGNRAIPRDPKDQRDIYRSFYNAIEPQKYLAVADLLDQGKISILNCKCILHSH